MTAQETRQLAADLNRAMREQRQRDDAAHAQMIREIDQMTELACQGPHATSRAPSKASKPGIDTAAVYAERNSPRTDTATPAATPTKPRTVRDLAASYYDAQHDGADAIPTSPRGGAR